LVDFGRPISGWGKEEKEMIELLVMVYFAASLGLVIAALTKFPPRSGRRREPEEWLIAITLCWLIWPWALIDLLGKRKRHG